MKPAMLALVLAGCGSTSVPDSGCAAFDRACVVDGDCAVVNHQLNCCGSQVVTGVAAKSLPASQRLEEACAARFPFCECATRPPVAEDGKEIVDPTALKVHCTSGRCLTAVN